MSTMSLNTELFHQLSLIADDEKSMKKVLNAVKKIVIGRTASTDTYIPRKKENLLNDLEEALADAKSYKESGSKEFNSAEALLNEL